MSAAAFSTNDDVIERKIDLHFQPTSAQDIVDVYEIKRCEDWIHSNGYRRVALQFPDELLADAPKVTAQLQHDLTSDVTIFILGDTYYGSCCVDEVAAEHYKADCLIHYGHTCLSPTTRLPVLYVFGKATIDVADCVRKIEDGCSQVKKAVLVYDTTFSHAADDIYLKVQPYFDSIVLSQLLDSQQNKDSDTSTIVPAENDSSYVHTPTAFEPAAIKECNRVINLPKGDLLEDYSFLFIGSSESATLTNMIMHFNKCPFYTYNPVNKVFQRETVNVNKSLMKRYYLIEKTKDANIVGIVVGTLGVAKYLDIIDHLKALLKATGKKTYTFVVGKLNPAKLANFAEIEVYVLVACSESTLLRNQGDFFQPVVSPLEVEIACNKAREWTGDYTTDFSILLPGAASYIKAPTVHASDETDVSLISNKIRTLGVQDNPPEGSSQAVVLKSDESLAVAQRAENAGDFLAGRSWKGLERKLGETPVTKATEGQRGIAVSYDHEPGS